MRMVSQYTLEYRAAVFTMLWGLWLIFGNETSLDATAFSYLKSTVDSVAFHSIPTHISPGTAPLSAPNNWTPTQAEPKTSIAGTARHAGTARWRSRSLNTSRATCPQS